MAVAGGDIGNAGAMGGYNPLDPLGLGLGGNISLSSSAPVNPKAGSGTASNIPLSGNVNITQPALLHGRRRAGCVIELVLKRNLFVPNLMQWGNEFLAILNVAIFLQVAQVC